MSETSSSSVLLPRVHCRIGQAALSVCRFSQCQSSSCSSCPNIPSGSFPQEPLSAQTQQRDTGNAYIPALPGISGFEWCGGGCVWTCRKRQAFKVLPLRLFLQKQKRRTAMAASKEILRYENFFCYWCNLSKSMSSPFCHLKLWLPH